MTISSLAPLGATASKSHSASALYQLGFDHSLYWDPHCASFIAVRAELKSSPRNIARGNVTETVSPEVSAAGADEMTRVAPVTLSLPSSWMWPRVVTAIVPRQAATAPMTTRSPLPSMPRVDSLLSFEESSGRLTANTRSISAAGRPGPLSVTVARCGSPVSVTSLAPLSSALSTNSLSTPRPN